MDGSVSAARSCLVVAAGQDSEPAADGMGGGLFLRWPRVGVVELGASTRAAADARRYVVACLGEWNVPFQVRDDMELVCSELVANALEATRSLRAAKPPAQWPLGLRLLGDRRRIVLEVWDCHQGVPVPRAPGEVASGEAECGRGLAIVEALSHQWGWRRVSAHVKAVWAELLLPTPTTVTATAAPVNSGER